MELSDLDAAAEKCSAQWLGDDVHKLPGVELQVRPMSAPEVQRFLGRTARKRGPDERDEKGLLTEEVMDQIHDQSIPEVILLGWKGITDKGAEVPHSKEMAQTLMTKAPFAKAVQNSVNHVTLGASRALEDLAKNSREPSPNK